MSQEKWDGSFIGPVGLAVVAGVLALFWPAAVWHGYGGPTGNDWRWDIHSTVACGIYWGVLALLVLPAWIGNRMAPPRRRPDAEVTAPVNPDPAVTAGLLAELEAIDGYMSRVEKARTGEELDILRRGRHRKGGTS